MKKKITRKELRVRFQYTILAFINFLIGLAFYDLVIRQGKYFIGGISILGVFLIVNTILIYVE